MFRVVKPLLIFVVNVKLSVLNVFSIPKSNFEKVNFFKTLNVVTSYWSK